MEAYELDSGSPGRSLLICFLVSDSFLYLSLS